MATGNADSEPPAPGAIRRPTLRELAVVFLRLGTTAFGGPAAHIALMEDEVVARRRWLTREQFLDRLAATNLIPGPNSTELAIHVGLLAGWSGLVVAGLSFIVPAALIVTAAAWGYVTYGSLPEVAGVLYGVKPVVIAVVVQALDKLGRDGLKSWMLAVLGAAALAARFLGVDELLLLLGAGIAVALLRRWEWPPRPPRGGFGAPAGALVVPAAGVGAAGVAAAPFSLGALFLVFLKIGSVLFGSGYVLVAFLRSDLVERLGWITEEQLLDAVAVGQVTPGPVLTTATFVGYLLGGVPGAAVATAGIFLPAFFFVAISGPLVPRLRRSPTAGAFLDGVVVASLALMAAAAWELGRAALVDVPTVALAVVSGVLLMRYRVNSAWLVLGGGIVGTAGALAGWAS